MELPAAACCCLPLPVPLGRSGGSLRSEKRLLSAACGGAEGQKRCLGEGCRAALCSDRLTEHLSRSPRQGCCSILSGWGNCAWRVSLRSWVRALNPLLQDKAPAFHLQAQDSPFPFQLQLLLLPPTFSAAVGSGDILCTGHRARDGARHLLASPRATDPSSRG